MSYLVFARKYRPLRFQEVVGQEHVARTLCNALENDRLAHAYLFCGPRGVGKTTMARILAKAVNCLVSPGLEPCGKCDACLGITAGSDVDVLEIDAASHRGVAEVEPLIDASRYLPQRSPRRVFIVDEAQMLSRHAWNSLLKTLEEPPPHVLFIFATTEPHKVIETVRSRCQRFDFRRITAGDIAAKLRRIAAAESVEVEEAVFEEIAERATGGLRDAESLLDQALSAAPADRPLAVDDLVAILGGIPRQARRRLLELARAGEMPAVLEEAAGLVDGGADPAELLRDLYGDLRDAAVAAACGREQAQGVEWCLAAAEIVSRHQRLAADSRAVRATLDLALLALARLGDVTDLERLAERLEGLAGGGSAAPEAPPPKGVDVRTELRNKLQRRGPDNGGLEQVSAPQENAPPGPARSQAPSGEELARIRGHPRVREVLKAFGGQIEHVRRTQDG